MRAVLAEEVSGGEESESEERLTDQQWDQEGAVPYQWDQGVTGHRSRTLKGSQVGGSLLRQSSIQRSSDYAGGSIGKVCGLHKV